MIRLNLSRFCCWFLIVGTVTASGCFSESAKKVVLGKVAGQVMLEGDPVRSGCVITFLPKSAGADIGSALIGEGGRFVATSGKHPGIPIGEYRVVVSPPKMDPKEEEELTKRNSQTVMTALINRDKKALDNVDYPQDAIVPRKYWNETTSGLTLTVKEGDNDATFELQKAARK